MKRASNISLITVVLLHLVVTVVHGAAHVGANVRLGPVAMAFVVIVIQLGPIAGLVYARFRPAAGALIVATTMAGSLLFGLVNHFVIEGADLVGHVTADWQALFGSTAVLLVISEAAGVAIGLWTASRTFGYRESSAARPATPIPQRFDH